MDGEVEAGVKEYALFSGSLLLDCGVFECDIKGIHCEKSKWNLSKSKQSY